MPEPGHFDPSAPGLRPLLYWHRPMLKLNPATDATADARVALRLGPLGQGLTPGKPGAAGATGAPGPAGHSASTSADERAASVKPTVVGPVVALLLADVSPRWRVWGWSRIVRGSRPLRTQPGLRWARVMGSGHGGGFGLRPSASHQGVLAVFDDLASAQAFVQQGSLVATYRERSQECLTALLQPWSVRGSWGGQGIALPDSTAPAPALLHKPSAPAGPVVALTRASIRPLKAAPFWAMAPAAQADLLTAPGCRLAAGLGEAPLLRQCTVSLWDSVAAMDAYARSGAHLAAIRAAAVNRFFSESMFVRFNVLALEGCWQGRTHG